MVVDSKGNPTPAESVLQLREANLKNIHHDYRDSSRSSDDEDQISRNKKQNN